MAEFATYPDMNYSSLPTSFASPSAVFSEEKVHVPKAISHYYEIATRGHQNADVPENKPHIPKKCRTKTYNYMQYMQRKFGNRYCENCDLGFYSLEDFEFHLTSHSKCPFADCDFVGCIEALENHMTYQHMLHESSSRKINNDQYRQERLKNFPTANKHILKEELLKKKKERGELFGLGENKKRLHSNNRKLEFEKAQKRPKFDNNNKSDREVPECRETVECDPAVETVECDRKRYTKRRPSPFRGIGSDGIDSEVLFPRKELKMETTEKFDDFDISDEEETTNNNGPTKTSSVGGLGALMNYGSDSEEDAIDIEATTQVEDELKRVSNNIVEQNSSDSKNKVSEGTGAVRRKRNRSNKSSKSHQSDDSVSKEESNGNARGKRSNLKPSHHNRMEDIPITERAFVKEEILASRCMKRTYKKFQYKFKESLLSQLLKDETVRERNVLLQCTRYIVKNTFFEQKQ